MTSDAPYPVHAAAPAQAALETFLKWLHHAGKFDLVLAVHRKTETKAAVLRGVPQLPPVLANLSWRWTLPADLRTGWSALETRNLPSAFAAGLPFRPAQAWCFIPASTDDTPPVALLCLSATTSPGTTASVPPDTLDEPSFCQLFVHLALAYQAEKEQALCQRQFIDAFNGLALAIVLVNHTPATAQVNRQAAALLGTRSGKVHAHQLSQAMARLRAQCLNSAELEAPYRQLQSNPDAEIHCLWKLASHNQVLRVVTRRLPIAQQHTRIWIFEDATAQVRLEETLRREASLDPLTQLLNRRSWFRQVRAIYDAPSPERQAPAVLLLDLDHFKNINDQYGHGAGDDVLRTVAHRIAGPLRSGDLLGRYGGEEFIVFLPPMTVEQAVQVAERLRTAVADAPVRSGHLRIGCTVSIGMALRIGQESLRSLIRRADSNLYHAKHAGRNQVSHNGH